jgi:clan AA aspartic protease
VTDRRELTGKVLTKIKLTNLDDVANAGKGVLRLDQVRELEIEALVDTGATNLVLPADVVATLGVRELGKRKVRYADNRVEEVPWVGPLQIEILGRTMIGEALVVAASATPLIGQIPLENLALIVDPKSREVSVNPASPDVPLLDLLRAGVRAA